MTPDEFDAGMAVLFSVWPKEASSPQTLEVYAEIVNHLPGDVWRAAALKCVTACTFFPKPVELLQAAQELTTAPQRTGADAWGDVVAAIAKWGVYHPPGGVQVLAVAGDVWDFDDPIVAKLVKAFGWRDLCLSENAVADRARFIPAYEQEQQREREQARLTPALAAFQADHRPALPAPAERRQAAARLLAGIGRREQG